MFISNTIYPQALSDALDINWQSWKLKFKELPCIQVDEVDVVLLLLLRRRVTVTKKIKK
jgi:hypothetical protein